MIGAEKEVQKELSYLDHDLWLDKKWSPFGYMYYVVLKRIEGHEPLTVVDWREGNTPLPLSLDLVDKVRSQEGDISDAIAQATANNAARHEMLLQERLKIQEEIAQEYHKWDKRGFVKLPTGITPTDSKL